MLKALFYKLFQHFQSRKIEGLVDKDDYKFLEAFPNPVFWTDRKKVYQGCNQLFADLIGLSQPSDIVGLTSKDLPFSLETFSKREEILDKILDSKTTVSILYDYIIGPQDQAVWAQKRFTPLKDKKGNIVGVLGTVVDISEHVYQREKIDGHIVRKHILSNFFYDLNKTSILSPDCYNLAERIITILKDTSHSDLAIWGCTNAVSADDFVRFATSPLDTLTLFENKNTILNSTSSYGYLDNIAINALSEVYPEVESVLLYRMVSETFPVYDDIILLINPNQEKIQKTSVRIVLAHHIINYYYIHCFFKTSGQANLLTNHS